MPVRNEERHLPELLAALLAQDYPVSRYEILVVDGDSDDRTRAVAEEFAARESRVRVLDNPRRWSSAARNVGWRAARGDVVIVVDGHCELTDRSYLAKLADIFQRTSADGVGRPQPLLVGAATTLQRAIAAARQSRLGHHPDSLVFATGERPAPAHSVGVAYRRDVLAKLGGFDERFDACEDVDLNTRFDHAGFRCIFSDAIRLPYHPRGSLTGLFRQLVRYGRGRMRLARKHPATFSWKSFLPALFVLGVLAGPLVAIGSSALAGVYFGVLALYAAIVVAASLAVTAAQRDLPILPLLPVVFGVVHAAAGWGALVETVAGPARPFVPPRRDDVLRPSEAHRHSDAMLHGDGLRQHEQQPA